MYKVLLTALIERILWTAITVGPHLNYKAKKLYEAVYYKLTSLTQQAAKKGIQADTQLGQTDEDSAQGQGSLKATITQVDSWGPIQEAISKAPPGSCVVFDIDGVILDEVTKNLVDPEILDVVELIKRKEFKAYALTHGGWGTYRCYQNIRFNTIKRLGIDFLELSQFQGYLEIPWVWKGSVKTALLKDGIIFARDGIDACIPKGPIFFEVLDRLDEHPTHVIFIDDRKYNLLSMKKECRKRRIPFQGLWATFRDYRPRLRTHL